MDDKTTLGILVIKWVIHWLSLLLCNASLCSVNCWTPRICFGKDYIKFRSVQWLVCDLSRIMSGKKQTLTLEKRYKNLYLVVLWVKLYQAYSFVALHFGSCNVLIQIHIQDILFNGPALISEVPKLLPCPYIKVQVVCPCTEYSNMNLHDNSYVLSFYWMLSLLAMKSRQVYIF